MHNKLIRFTANWCADCIVMRPRWKKSFDNYKDLQIVDYDLDDNEGEVARFKVTHVPELLVVDAYDNEIARLTGMKDTEELEEMLRQHFTKN